MPSKLQLCCFEVISVICALGRGDKASVLIGRLAVQCEDKGYMSFSAFSAVTLFVEHQGGCKTHCSGQ